MQSYGRHDCATTIELIPESLIVVPESQASDYIKNWGKRVVVVADEKDGSPTKKKNAILDLMDQGELAWIIDDDLINVKNIQTNRLLKSEEILETLENHWNVMQEMGAGFGGFNTTDDFIRCEEFRPFSLYKISYSCFCVRKTHIKHDERLKRVDDIDFFLQLVHQGILPFRDNRYFFKFHWNDEKKKEQITQKGGIDGGHEQHTESTEILIKKWGDCVRMKNGRVTGVKVPIKAC